MYNEKLATQEYVNNLMSDIDVSTKSEGLILETGVSKIHNISEGLNVEVDSFSVYGESKQKEVLGKVFDFPFHTGNRTGTYGGVDVIDDGNGVLTFNGTATEDFIINFTNPGMPEPFIIDEECKIKLSGCPKGGSLETYYMSIFQLQTVEEQNCDFGEGVVMKNNPGDPYIIQILVKKGVTFDNAIFMPKIEEYLGVSPETPSEVVSMEDARIYACGTNIVYVGEKLNWNGVRTVNCNIDAGEYYISFKDYYADADGMPYITFVDNSCNISFNEIKDGYMITLEKPETMVAFYSNGYTQESAEYISAGVDEFMISPIKNVDYQPYKEEFDETLNGVILRGLANSSKRWVARDEIMVKNKQVLLVRNIGRKVLSATDTINIGNYKALDNGKGFTGSLSIFEDRYITDKTEENIMLANIYTQNQVASPSELSYGEMFPALNDTSVYITFPTECETAEQAEEWLTGLLSEKNISLEFIYRLAEPVVENVTNTEYGQKLLKLKTAEPSITIVCDGDCRVGYKANISKVYKKISNKINELQEALISLGGNI